MANVNAVRNTDVWEDGSAPGAYDFDADSKYIIYRCPCGCGELRSVPIMEGEKQERSWQWNGSKEKPTLTPSLLHIAHDVKGCTWHGYLTDGVWITV